MIGLRLQAGSAVSLQAIEQGGRRDAARTTALSFAHTLQVGTSGVGVIRLHPDDMRAPCRAGPGCYRWMGCEAVTPGPSRF